ncbi:MAG: hypothetical protein P8Y28_03375 [Gammaproteobacteria bacterium]|jgi:uncharacterized protein YpmS
MNAFKLDLMTLLAIFVILAVVVTMTLGSGDNDKTSIGSFGQQKSPIATVSGIASSGDSSFSYRASQSVLPTSKFVSRSWH